MSHPKQLTSESQLVGKTIERFIRVCYSMHGLSFIDGTFALLSAGTDSDCDAYLFVSRDTPGIEDQYKLGLISWQERDEQLRREREQQEAEAKENRRYQYERLKQEFGE